MAKHVDHLKVYFSVFGALLGLTALTVYVAYANLGAWAAPVAVGIACVKATLVILYFMHVRYETRLNGMYAVSGFAFLLILFVITMGEVAGRAKPGPDPLAPSSAAQR
jgi:cytochrome c oxidase subunit 4